MSIEYNHIIWDWNGTLLNDVDFCRRIINRILVKNNLPELSLERYRDVFTFPVRDYYERAGLDFSKTPFEELGTDFMVEYEEKKLTCSIYKGSRELLSMIRENGIKQSVLSAYKEDSLISILDAYKLTEYFDFIVGSDSIYAGGKTGQGLMLIEKLKEDRSKILFVGDTLHDYEVAKAMKVNSVLIGQGHQAKYKLQQNGIVVLDDLKDLKEYLFGNQ